jgi:peptidoglycan-N-acetylglucosamine deacetylase
MTTTATFPVVLGICLDAEAIWLGKDPAAATKPCLLSHGTYAILEGLAQLLATLQRHAARATFFVPGLTAERYPDAVREIAAHGHEIGSHGHGHRSPPLLSAEEERSELLRGIESLEQITGSRPVTWRSPSWEITERTIPLLLEAGIRVSTNFHDRSRPYRHTRNGAAIDLVELAVQWHLADAPYFMYAGIVGRMLTAPSLVEETWREEFLGLYERPGCFFHLTLHVQLIGHPGRLRMLDRLLGFMAGHDRVAFMTSNETAATVA